ncbi:MAG: DUF2779 domain-containing protein [Desulfobacteraceae bacterium]|nr:DUF2779 domain-containing protein [Desulfobacteraceae bacterium]
MDTFKISKSQYIRGLQCPKSLWYFTNQPSLCKDQFNGHNTLFGEGIEVGMLAQNYFKNGITINFDLSRISESTANTKDAVKNGCKVIFEATACTKDGVLSRIDILKKVDSSEYWDLMEVKMSTEIKDHHLDDMAFQRYVFLNSGYKIRKSILMYINNTYVRSGELSLNDLFILKDCTDDVLKRLTEVKKTIERLVKTVNSKDEPNIETGNHCKKPFVCEYNAHCSPKVTKNPVNEIFSSSQKLNWLKDNGIKDLKNIPKDFKMTEREAIAVRSVKKNKVHLNKKEIKNFLNKLIFPVYYLDYETFFPAIPLFDNSKPYQQIPFQYSLHIQNEIFGSVKHIEFLHGEKTDPRPSFVKNLINNCGDIGSIIVYNKAFEARINKELGENFPKWNRKLLSISNRMLDLLLPFRSRMIYHPKMRGSASIKKVLPAFVPELNYNDLEISEGTSASLAYLKFIKNLATDEEKNHIFKDLKKYCALDTYAEVILLKFLFESCSSE